MDWRTLTAWPRLREAIALIVLALCSLPALDAAADEILVLSDSSGAKYDWRSWLSSFEANAGVDVRVGALAAWPSTPDEGALKTAKAGFRRGEDAFLALNIRSATAAFGEARGRYEALAEANPFDKEITQTLSLSSFYQIRAQFQARQKRQARRSLAALLEARPLMRPDPGIFPPDFREQVEAARGKVIQKDKAVVLTLQISPPEALVRVGGAILEPESGIVQVTLPKGQRRVLVGWPGVGIKTIDLDLKKNTKVVADMLGWPEGLPRAESGRPVSKALISALKVQGVTAVIWMTEGRALGIEGQALFAQRTSDGGVTALVALGGSALSDSVSPLTEAMGTEATEVYRLEEGRAVTDEGLAEALQDLLSGKIHQNGGIDEPSGGPSVRLGVDIGTGFGVATQVTDPGLAPTPLHVRPDFAIILGERLDLGVGLRLQLVDFAVLGEPYLRWRFSWVHLRFGLGLGEINHKILQTENRNNSVEGFVGPTLGLEIPVGPVVIGAGLLAPLFPRATIHGDLSLGLAFDL